MRNMRNALIAFTDDKFYAKCYLEKFLNNDSSNSSFILMEKPDSYMDKYRYRYPDLELIPLINNTICTIWEREIWYRFLIAEHDAFKTSIELVARRHLARLGKLGNPISIETYLSNYLTSEQYRAYHVFDSWLAMYGTEKLDDLISNTVTAKCLKELNNEFLRKMSDERE